MPEPVQHDWWLLECGHHGRSDDDHEPDWDDCLKCKVCYELEQDRARLAGSFTTRAWVPRRKVRKVKRV